ncbi:30S ribosomal protein S3 [Alienimonas californiensis]|uniref:Small ribosomal subunit protein uS3 n=1 Tax=Alienimonas californiensis TaxID=2527989 RepID=A0A517P9I0_9PLAN|nr:30S ribosomal protein S3 [Alienimonas californiensis]QDT16037.1 30S ribosomal protein S3 [Alienimonas californiensis]
MGQKTRPTGFRVGITEPHRSKWYANKKNFGDLLVEDHKIRSFIKAKNNNAAIARVDIERTRDSVVVHLHSAKPGVLIGSKGQNVDRVKAELEDLTGRRMDVKIVELSNPNRNAVLVAEDLAGQLERRGSFRRAIKRTMDSVMESGVLGVKMELAGRLGGSEMSRREKASRGSIPLSTLRRHIDYGFAQAKTAQGIIGVKVWIDLGDYSEETNGVDAQAGQAPQAAKRAYKR